MFGVRLVEESNPPVMQTCCCLRNTDSEEGSSAIGWSQKREEDAESDSASDFDDYWNDRGNAGGNAVVGVACSVNSMSLALSETRWGHLLEKVILSSLTRTRFREKEGHI